MLDIQLSFIKSVIRDFKRKNESRPIVPDWLFEQRKTILFKLPHCPRNEYDLKHLLRKLKALLKVK